MKQSYDFENSVVELLLLSCVRAFLLFLTVGKKWNVASICMVILSCCLLIVKAAVFNMDRAVTNAHFLIIDSAVFCFLELICLQRLLSTVDASGKKSKKKKDAKSGYSSINTGTDDQTLEEKLLDGENDAEDEDLESGKKKSTPEGPSPATLGRVLSLAGPEKWLLTMGIIALIVSSLSDLAIPYFIGQLINSISTSTGGKGSLGNSALTLTGIFTVGSIFTFLRAATFNYSGERVVARLRRDLYGSLIKQEVAFFDESQVGELINRIGSDTTVLQDAVTTNISMVLRFSAQAILGLGLLFFSSVKLTFIMLGVGEWKKHRPLLKIFLTFWVIKIRLLYCSTCCCTGCCCLWKVREKTCG